MINNAVWAVFNDAGQTIINNHGQTTIHNPGQTIIHNPGQTIVNNPGQPTIHSPGQTVINKPTQTITNSASRNVIGQPATAYVHNPAVALCKQGSHGDFLTEPLPVAEDLAGTLRKIQATRKDGASPVSGVAASPEVRQVTGQTSGEENWLADHPIPEWDPPLPDWIYNSAWREDAQTA
jgi:hypothetical protein